MHGRVIRDHIVAAADPLFYRQGFEHTSFAAIADAVQISRGNFYYYFKSKDKILDAVIHSVALSLFCRRTNPMFIVRLKFSSNKSQAGQFMEGHKAWIKRGMADARLQFLLD